jgi:hypothetical protein
MCVTPPVCTGEGSHRLIPPSARVAPTNGSAPPTNHEDPRDVTYIVVIAAALRELANREPQCMVALVFAGGTALSTMRRRLPRSLRRPARAGTGRLPAPDASL